jgi:hypothetical protein
VNHPDAKAVGLDRASAAATAKAVTAEAIRAGKNLSIPQRQ